MRDILNKGESDYSALISKYPKLTQCSGKFRARVDCYIYCPEIGDDGQIRSASMGWGTCESSH